MWVYKYRVDMEDCVENAKQSNKGKYSKVKIAYIYWYYICMCVQVFTCEIYIG